MYEFALVNWFYCCVYCDPYKSDFLISLLIFFALNHLHRKMQQNFVVELETCPPKRGDHRFFFETMAKNSMVQCGISSAHTLKKVQKDVNRRPGGWSYCFREWKDNATFPFETPAMLVQDGLLSVIEVLTNLVIFLLGVHCYHMLS